MILNFLRIFLENILGLFGKSIKNKKRNTAGKSVEHVHQTRP
jgi:hypothetical protein